MLRSPNATGAPESDDGPRADTPAVGGAAGALPRPDCLFAATAADRVLERIRRQAGSGVGLADALTPEQVCNAVVESALEELGATAAAVALQVPGEDALELMAWPGVPAEVARAWHRFALSGPGPLSEAVRTGHPIYVESRASLSARYPDLLGLAARLGVHSAVAVPARAGDEVRGVLALGFAEERAFDDTARWLMADYGHEAASALLRVRLHETERRLRVAAERAVDRVRRLQAVTAALSSSASAGQVLGVIVRQAMSALGADAGAVLELTQDGREFVLLESFGYPDEMMKGFRRFPADSPIPARDAARSGEPLFLDSPEQWLGRYTVPPQWREFGGARSWAVLPLLAGGAVRGVLTLSFLAPATLAAQDDRDFAVAVAGQCAHALERARLYEQALEAALAKDEFLGVVSHELRTPLTSIIAYTDLLLMEQPGPLVASQRAFLERLRFASGHLRGLIDHLLDFSRLEAGQEALLIRKVDIGALAREAAGLVEPDLDHAGLELAVRQPEATVVARTDRGMLRQVLVNLLTNAVKFTRRGRVTVEVAQEDGRAVIRVCDTGVGIRAEDTDRIFEPFHQSHVGLQRRPPGLGLGLALTRRLIDMLDGELSVESQPGEGSVFTVCVPLVREPRSQPPPWAPAA